MAQQAVDSERLPDWPELIVGGKQVAPHIAPIP
jgi:hypothetical protein